MLDLPNIAATQTLPPVIHILFTERLSYTPYDRAGWDWTGRTWLLIMALKAEMNKFFPLATNRRMTTSSLTTGNFGEDRQKDETRKK